MATEVDVDAETTRSGGEPACPLERPFTGRVPALISLAALPGAVLVNPVFFGLAGGLLAIISLLLSPPRYRTAGLLALAGSIAAGLTGLFLVR